MTGKLRVACVGAGYFSQFQYGSWARLTQVEVVGACNRSIEKARATGFPAYGDLATMLAETKPDVLDNILPPALHMQTIQTAIDAGVKTLICQKPICRDKAEATPATAAAEAAGMQIIVHENFRFQPWYRALKPHLSDGRVGELLQVTFRLRPGDGQGPEAYLARQPYFQQMPRFLVHETAVHWVDTFRYLFGPITSVYADLRRLNPAIAGEDAGHVIFDHASGVRSLFDGNRHLDHAADNLRRTMGEAWIEGTGGVLTLYGNGSVTRRALGSQTDVMVLASDTWDGFGGDCVHALQSHVIAAIHGAGQLENEAADYLTVLTVKDAIYDAAEAGRKLNLKGV